MSKVMEFFDKHKEGINKFVPYFLLSYFVLIFAPYVFARVPALNNFFVTNPTNIIYRSITTVYFVVYFLLLGLSNKFKVKWPVVILGSSLLILYLISTLTAPHSYVISGDTKVVGALSYAVSYFRFAADVVCFALLIMFLPPALKDIKQLYLTLYVLIGVMVFACIFAFAAEWNHIVALFQGQDEYANEVRSIFHSKNSFGLFLFVASLSSTFIVYTSKNIKTILILFIPMMLFSLMAVLIGCKTALICNLILLITMFVYVIYLVYKEDRKAGIITISVVGGLLLIFTLYMTIPVFHSGPLSWLYNTVCHFFARMDYYFQTRVDLWNRVPEIVYGGYTLCGVTEANMGLYLGSTTTNIADFHSGYVSFYACHGVFGTIIYGGVFAWIGYMIVKLIKKDKINGFLSMIFFLCSLFFMVPETYTMFLGISAYSFIVNLILVSFLQYSIRQQNN